MPIRQIQLGKSGITDNFINSLKNQFSKVKTVKISVLSSARAQGKEGKGQVKKYSEIILEKLGKNYTSRIIGFTIVIKKWRRDVR